MSRMGYNCRLQKFNVSVSWVFSGISGTATLNFRSTATNVRHMKLIFWNNAKCNIKKRKKQK
jgi:hypothetical protein